MKPAPWHHLDQYRLKDGEYGTPNGANYGVFFVKPFTRVCKIIASPATLDTRYPWDHVSVSISDRCPTWDEMEFIKRLFFADNELAMQLHMPVADHINFHPFCLHIWKPLNDKIPTPPSILVGPPARP